MSDELLNSLEHIVVALAAMTTAFFTARSVSKKANGKLETRVKALEPEDEEEEEQRWKDSQA